VQRLQRYLLLQQWNQWYMEPATISTATAGTTTYTFTPDAGQCATATATVDVTVTGAVTPTFDPVGNLCIGATAPLLPAASNNGINGTWNLQQSALLQPVQLLYIYSCCR
jgi:hypothetical protein